MKLTTPTTPVRNNSGILFSACLPDHCLPYPYLPCPALLSPDFFSSSPPLFTLLLSSSPLSPSLPLHHLSKPSHLLSHSLCPSQLLMTSAPHFVPLLTSNLDDLDESARIMACLCLTISFERLRLIYSIRNCCEIY